MPVLTSSIINNAEIKDKIYYIWDDMVRGFALKVIPNGPKKYVIKYRTSMGGRNAVQRWYIFGCTNKEQALREATYMALANRYRRRIVTFTTELEGLIPSYGDLIAITHDMAQWGQGGEILKQEGLKLTLSEPVTFKDG